MSQAASAKGINISPYRIAVVGSGPSGFYAAESLLRSGVDVEVDVFERLPMPHGLVRYGVAPDHQKLKQVISVFDQIADDERFRYFGNVEVGADISLDELRQYYHAVILACGAEEAKSLGIPGEDLPGCVTARDFVSWYNGHPDSRLNRYDFSTENAVIIGHGNVALDVARILAKPIDQLQQTDIADHALASLARSQIKNIYIVGRRGPKEAKFSPKELREVCTDPIWRTTISQSYSACFDDGHKDKNLELFTTCLNAGSPESHGGTGRKNIFFEFFLSPRAVLGHGKVEGIVFSDHRQPVHQIPAPDRTIACGLVVGCVGYEVKSFDNISIDIHSRTIPNRDGRVMAGDQAVPGLYVVGWAKRGAQGTIGTNRGDSALTVASLLDDIKAAFGPKPSRPDVINVLRNNGCQPVSYAQWKEVDAFETICGKAQGRPRVKITSKADFLMTIGVKEKCTTQP